jgi:hypothetical protein
MAGFQIENGSCTGRGFSALYPDGFCAKFYTWAVKAYAAGGPNWYLWDDFSSVTSKTFAPTDVNTTSEEITITAHGHATGTRVQVSSTGTIPGNISAGTNYYVIRISDNVIKLSTSVGGAIAGTVLNISSQGTGIHTLEPYEYFAVFTNTAAPVVNDYHLAPDGGAPKFLKIGYFVDVSARVNIQTMAWWDATNHVPRGIWSGFYLTTYDASNFEYNFRGGCEQMVIMARTGSTWTNYIYDDFVGDTNFLEDETHVGVLISGITAGTNVVLQLGTGQANNFTLNQYYYIYDFNGHTWVNYVKCTNVNIGADQITVDTIIVGNNFPTGSVIASYPIRQYSRGSNLPGDVSNYQYSSFGNNANPTIPFISSSVAGCQFHNQSGAIVGTSYFVYFTELLGNVLQPDDLGRYGSMRLVLLERWGHNGGGFVGTGCNRLYGVTKNLYRCSAGSMAKMLDYKIIGTNNWLYFQDESTYAVLCLHTESLT